MDVIVRYNWPGNVRELENAIERAMVVGKPPAILPEDLPFRLSEKNNMPHTGSLAAIEKTHIADTCSSRTTGTFRVPPRSSRSTGSPCTTRFTSTA